MTAVAPARKIAFEILLKIERGKAHSDDQLRGKAVTTLSPPDRHLATALVMGVLRWQIWLDEQIRQLLQRPGAKLDVEVLIALRLGAFQLLRLERIPAHAAIDESVELAKQSGHRFASRMVNAVLRKMAKQKPLEHVNPSAGFPPWLVDRWSATYGGDAALAICMQGQSEPPTAMRITDSEAEEELRRARVELEQGPLLSAARIVKAGEVAATDAFRDGRVRFQDEGSQLVAEIAGHGEQILDACAAPGGKTLVLAERNPDARIVALEVSPQRLGRLRERLASLGERVECRLGDAAEIADAEAYDLVLADVPCSGTGTLGRNPEIRHRVHLQDLPRQAGRQIAVLRAALGAVRPGGRVVYSTCSLEPEENEDVVAAVMREHANVRVLSVRERVAAMDKERFLVSGGAERLAQCVTSEGYLRLLPGLFGTDGFFVALLEKTQG
jgi:16S rRNA (cytosine967-C5)-methyltransferase